MVAYNYVGNHEYCLLLILQILVIVYLQFFQGHNFADLQNLDFRGFIFENNLLLALVLLCTVIVLKISRI